ncbi:MAG: glycoside hydrolase family 3 C-terminal domain-containing protein [Phycisphaerales bacterium]|nr:glycoside hydrolase family 3 C-terminal domain-containing protein [Phycisphaerales bacterium]
MGVFQFPFLLLWTVTSIAGAIEPPWVDLNRNGTRDIYENPEGDFLTRTHDLIDRMTTDERIAQLVNSAPAIERLGVPAYDYWSECLHGVARAGEATVFPQCIGLAATWNPELVEEIAHAIAIEGRAKFHEAQRKGNVGIYRGLTFFTPNINIFRDPRWGRGHETYGEDPYLTSRMGVAFIRGLQGDGKYLKAVATAKHFAVHSGPEPERHRFNAIAPEQDFYDTYLPHFEAAVREGGVWSVMGAYNAVYGVPANASQLLLDDLLRDKWGFRGYVVTDCWAIRDIWERHKYSPTTQAACASAILAGCDLECGPDFRYLRQALDEGLVDEFRIRVALARVLETRFRLGLFDPPELVPLANTPMSKVCAPEHAALALRAARESIVLLKNKPILPLNLKKLQRVAVIGPNADSLPVLLGNYNGTPRSAPTFIEEFRTRYGDRVQIDHMRGCNYAASIGDYEPIPDAFLRSEGQSGLKAEYFANRTLSGRPIVTRRDHVIDYSYYFVSHVVGLGTQDTSARWTGEFVAPLDGEYTLGVRGDDGVRLWIGGDLILDRWVDGRHDVITTTMMLRAGETVPIRIEQYQNGGESGCALLWNRKDIDATPYVAEQAADADVVIFCGGIYPGLEGEEGEVHFPLEGFGKGGDRIRIEMPEPQTGLMRALCETGKPVVLVNFSGSAIAMPWEAANVDAILQVWYPGQCGSAAICDVLFGDYNPAGRLPVTFYASTNDLPPFEDYSMRNRTYRFFRGEPLWRFGFGGSYSEPFLSMIRVNENLCDADQDLRVSRKIDNFGGQSGDFVFELYSARIGGDEFTPIRELVQFERIPLVADSMKTIESTVPISRLRKWNSEMRGYSVVPGQYEFQVPELFGVKWYGKTIEVR